MLTQPTLITNVCKFVYQQSFIYTNNILGSLWNSKLHSASIFVWSPHFLSLLLTILFAYLFLFPSRVFTLFVFISRFLRIVFNCCILLDCLCQKIYFSTYLGQETFPLFRRVPFPTVRLLLFSDSFMGSIRIFICNLLVETNSLTKMTLSINSCSLQPGHYSSLTAPNLQPTANQERNDQCDNQNHSRELLMMGIVMLETC